jgi:hypothetical protein
MFVAVVFYGVLVKRLWAVIARSALHPVGVSPQNVPVNEVSSL